MKVAGLHSALFAYRLACLHVGLAEWKITEGIEKCWWIMTVKLPC
jgi:hypothetical protein